MKRVLFFLTALILILTGCGETEEAIPTNTPSPPTSTPVPTATPVPTPTLEPTATPIPVADLVAEGDELLWESDWEGAEAIYEEVIELHPTDPLAYAHLSYLHVQQPQTRKQAMDEAQQAADLAPEDAEILAYLVKALDFNVRFDEALEVAETAYELAPDHPLVLAVLAEVYLDTNQYDEALSTAKQAVEIDPDSMEGHRSLAVVYATMQDWEQANDEAQAAYFLHPHFAPIMVTKSTFLGLADDEKTQKQVLNMALEHAPDYTPVLLQLAGYHRKLEEYDEALELCDQIVDLEPELPGGYVCRGDTYLARDVYDDALRN